MTKLNLNNILEINKSLTGKVAELKSTVEDLTAQLAWFRRQVFGPKSERYIADSNQTELDLGIVPEAIVEEKEVINTPRPKNKRVKHSREKIPDNLTRVNHVIEPDVDTSNMKRFSEKITEKLEIEPARFYVTRIIRPVYVNITEDGVRELVHAELPNQCIDKGKAGATLVAKTIVTKCVDHNPLYRFSRQIERDCDLKISESTLNGWYQRGIFWMSIIEEKIHEKIVHSNYLQIDETTIQVMIKSKKGKTHKGYMWLYFDPLSKVVLFDFHKSRSTQSLNKILGDEFSGVVQSDCYQVYEPFCKNHKLDLAACMAHARRKFDEAKKNNVKLSNWMLTKLKVLFEVEREAERNNLTFDERLKLRQEKSSPVITEMRTWCEETIQEVTPKSKIGKAIAYMLNHWEKLIYILKDGRIEISNNWIENLVRPLAIGRKNFMFAGSEEGAKRLATAYSVLSTCKLLGVNPFRYLCDILEKLPLRNVNDIDDLLPWNWKEPKKEVK